MSQLQPNTRGKAHDFEGLFHLVGVVKILGDQVPGGPVGCGTVDRRDAVAMGAALRIDKYLCPHGAYTTCLRLSQ